MSANADSFKGAGVPNGSVDAAAARWVLRAREGLEPSAAGELAAWRAGDPAHEAAFQRFSALADALQRARRVGAANAIAAELNVRAGRRRARRRVWSGLGMAALLILGASTWIHYQGRPTSPASVAASGRMQRLPDGSLVELNGDSEIRVKFEPVYRRVELLRGEALFSVAKNPNRPFIVRANGVEVRAVGTAFNVRLENAGLEVLVTEGKVRLDHAARGESLLSPAADGQPGMLVAGQKAVVQASGPRMAHVSNVAPAELAERLAWHHTRLEFSGVELARAVELINGRNRTQISLAEDSLGHLRLTGSFFGDDPETFARLVAETFNLEMAGRDGDRIELRPSARGVSGR